MATTGDDVFALRDTCGLVGASCSVNGTCEPINAYWTKQKALINEEVQPVNVQLVIEARGVCDEITLNEIYIYEKNVGPDIPIDTIIAGKKFTRGARSYTSVIDWTAKTVPSKWYDTALNIFVPFYMLDGFNGAFDYAFTASFVQKNKDGVLEQKSIESSIMKVTTQ